MEKKRLAPSEPDSSSMPPAKQLRPSEDVPQPSNRSNHASTHPAASTGPNSSAHRTDSNGDDAVVKFQRKQLAAKIKDQDRDVIWLREKVDELQKLVAVLDAAPRAALYHMGAVREDLTLTLARLGLSRELDPKDSPVAAVMLDAEVVTNDSLGEMPAAIKKLTAQIVLVMEAKDPERLSKDETQKLLDELQCRNRKVSDQLDRYSERDKQSLVSSTTLRDEYDDLRAVCSLQRRKIVALEHQMQEKQESLALQRQEDTRSGDESNAGIRSESNTKDSREPAGSSTADPNGDLVAIEEARVLAQKRLEELKQIQAQNKQHISEIETLRTDIARRDAHVVPIRTVLSTGLYQTMEATLQQLYLKERTWQMERDAQNEEREAERKDAQEQINELKAVAEKTSDDFKRQLEEMRRIADAAKVEKDKVVMTYEARKMEAGAAQAVTNAWEKRTSVSEAMRDKMEKANQSLSKEVESLRASLKEYENQAKEKASQPDFKATIDRLQREVEEERSKAAGFIEEVESLSNMFSEVESENEKLVKHLSEKEQVLSKVMAERLRGRQLLTTVKEENRVLSQGREIDNDKIKALTAAVAASKKAVQEANAAVLKLQQEERELSTTLEKRRRIADDATVASRGAVAEKDEMKRERDAYQSRAEQLRVLYGEDKFEANRLQERLVEAEKRAEKAKAALERQTENGRSSNVDTIRDEIIRELRKKLNCSIVTSKPKEVVLLRCGHLFSRQCTDNLIATRNRKCPICGEAFGKDDIRGVFF